MAVRREVIEHLTDDLDGSAAAETIRFSIDGRGYVIDLNKKNAAALRKALDPYRAAARRDSAARSSRRPGSAARPGGSVDAKAVRAWAKANRVKVPARGRIPSAVLEKYNAAS
ncbi:MAG TPA: Lsr2 family protein [Mycobacteriales bacterium]|nr:Lsr2 family protein [Mycobacteriales bacterium]